MGGKTRRASGNRKRLRLIFGRTNERTNERKERRKKTLEDARWVHMSTNGEMRSYSEICDERVSLARRFARCGAKCFCFFARRRRRRRSLRSRETYEKKTDAGMDRSVVLSKTIDAIDPRRLPVLAPRGGLECRRGGFSNGPTARPRQSAKCSIGETVGKKVADDAARRRAPRLFLVLLLSVGYFVVVSFVVRGPRAAETGERPANQSRSPSARGFGTRATERFRRSPPALVSSLLVPG